MKRVRTSPALLLLLATALLVAGCGPARPPETTQTGTAVPGAARDAAPLVESFTTPEHIVNLSARAAGSPRAPQVLIAINGSGAVTSHYMRDLEWLAGEQLRVVTYDQRGLGGSETPAAGEGVYGLAAQAEDVEALRRTLDVPKVHLLGHSWGGMIAMQYAIRYPRHVDKLVLVGTVPDWESTLAAGEAEERRIRELQRQGIIPDPLPGNPGLVFQAVLPASFSDPTFRLPDAPGTTFDFNVQREVAQAAQGFDLRADLARLQLPILLVYGADDYTMPTGIKTLLPALARAEVQTVIIPECGHFWQECPAHFFSALRDFLGLDS